MIDYLFVFFASLGVAASAYSYGWSKGRSSAFRDAKAIITAPQHTLVRVEDAASIPVGFLEVMPHVR